VTSSSVEPPHNEKILLLTPINLGDDYPIVIDYYFLPVSIFCLYFSLLNFGNSKSFVVEQNNQALKIRSTLLCFAILLGGGIYRLQIEAPSEVSVKFPARLQDKEAIVYAGVTGGIVNYYFGKYTAKLDFGGLCIAEQLLTRVALTGRTQYIINDTVKMQELMKGIGQNKFEKVGNLNDPTANYEVYQFKASNLGSYPLISCDLTVSRQFASNINLEFSGKADGDAYKGLATITNNSDTSFSTRPISGDVKISWRFLKIDNINTPPPWRGRRELSMMVEAKHSYDVDFIAPLPKEKGKYLLELTLVQEGFSWFHEYGMKIPTQMIVVN